MTIKKVLPIILSLILSGSSLASARYHRGRFFQAPSGNLAYDQGVIQLSPFGGFMMGDYFDAYIGNPPDYTRVRQDDSPTWGVRMGFGIAPNIGLEFQYSSSKTAFYTQHGGSFFDTHSKLSDVNIHMFLANINFDFSDSNIVPYFALGMGTTMFDVKRGTSQSEFTGTIAGGVKARLAPNLALRFETRGYVTQLPNSQYSGGWDGYYFHWESRHQTYLSTWDATLGLSFLF